MGTINSIQQYDDNQINSLIYSVNNSPNAIAFLKKMGFKNLYPFKKIIIGCHNVLEVLHTIKNYKNYLLLKYNILKNANRKRRKF